MARANTPASVFFRRFLPFSPWRAPARLRLKKQKSLENTSLAGVNSFVGAEMCPDKKRPAENTCRIVKGLDAVWAHFCPSKPCLPLSIDGSVKGNRQGSLSRSITRRSDQNRKIKYCFLFCDFASACQKSPNGLFDKLKRTALPSFFFAACFPLGGLCGILSENDRR